jgi:hypothetical protein
MYYSVFRKLFGRIRDKLLELFRILSLHNEELPDLYRPPNIVRGM